MAAGRRAGGRASAAAPEPHRRASALRVGDLVTGDPATSLDELMLGKVRQLGDDERARVRWYDGGECWEPRTALRRVVVADRPPAAWAMEGE